MAPPCNTGFRELGVACLNKVSLANFLREVLNLFELNSLVYLASRNTSRVRTAVIVIRVPI